MLGPFFRLAMLSLSRQLSFRRAVVVHLLIVLAGVVVVYTRGDEGVSLLGQFLLLAGIAEGAALLGWRLTQMPKSRALEFLLVTQLQPRRVFLAEASVGLARLALVTLSGLPILVLLVLFGPLGILDLGPLLVMPFTWGAITGLGLTVWAYEPVRIRRWGERFLLVMIVLYLVVGILIIDHLPTLGRQFGELGVWLRTGVIAFHIYNPFAVMRYWLEEQPWVAEDRMLGLELAALPVVGLLLVRSAYRMKGHFHDRHYRPVLDRAGKDHGGVGDWPLSWWAVKRVTEYSGRVNLWLAGGFGLLYAAYVAAGPAWPDFLGKTVFQIFERLGGVPMLTTGLVVLAAVPAAFQYGLWDSNAQDRCRRLELLLLTELGARDYWSAAAAAAWRRGRGYFFVAGVLWAAAAWAGQMSLFQVAAAVSAGVVLWALYFALGFRAFSRGVQANGLGSLLTLGLPILTVGLYYGATRFVTGLVPPGSVYLAGTGPPTVAWAVGPLLTGAAALVVGRFALAHCDRELRHWYEQHHGQKVVE